MCFDSCKWRAFFASFKKNVNQALKLKYTTLIEMAKHKNGKLIDVCLAWDNDRNY